MQQHYVVGIILVVVTLFVCALTSLAAGRDCYAESYKRRAEGLLDRWLEMTWRVQDVPKTSDAGAMRASLGPLVERLYQLRREAAAMTVPDCARSAHDLMLQYLDAQLLAFDAYMAGKPDVGAQFYEEAGAVGLNWSRAHCNLSPSRGGWLTTYMARPGH